MFYDPLASESESGTVPEGHFHLLHHCDVTHQYISICYVVQCLRCGDEKIVTGCGDERIVTGCGVAWYPARRKSAWCTLMRFRLIKNAVAHVYDLYTV